MSSSIPATPAEITPDWLSAALAGRFPGLEVTKVEVLDHHAGTTGRARLAVECAKDVGLPPTLFAKLPPDDPAQRTMVQVTGMGRKEARFYAELANELPVRIARSWYGGWSEDGASYLILMEDLEAAGCSFPNAVHGPDVAYTRAVVEDLARLHAHLWDSPRFDDELAWVTPPARHEIGPTLVARALDAFAGEMTPVFRDFGRLYVEHTDAVHDLWDEGEATLVHGDAHVGNLFEDHGRPGFLDWGVIGRTTGVRDVAHFLASGFDTALRRREQGDLLARYRAQLERSGAPAPSAEDLWRRYRLHVAYSWVAATTTIAMGDEWQPLEVTRKAVARCNAALEDLETVPLFRELLVRELPGSSA